LAIVLAAGLSAQAQQTTLRDANGRITGTVTTDSNGTKTFRNGTGGTTGTATIAARQRGGGVATRQPAIPMKTPSTITERRATDFPITERNRP
jgi:hypothetical protein